MKRQLADLEQRHKQLLQVEERLKEVHDLFYEIAVLVEMQVNTFQDSKTNTNLSFIFVHISLLLLNYYKRNELCSNGYTTSILARFYKPSRISCWSCN